MFDVDMRRGPLPSSLRTRWIAGCCCGKREAQKDEAKAEAKKEKADRLEEKKKRALERAYKTIKRETEDGADLRKANEAIDKRLRISKHEHKVAQHKLKRREYRAELKQKESEKRKKIA